jgi:hypothetical protein
MLTSHIHMMQRLRMSGDLGLLPPICLHDVDRNIFTGYASWCVAELTGIILNLTRNATDKCKDHILMEMT